jgi:hypothetical protein
MISPVSGFTLQTAAPQAEQKAFPAPPGGSKTRTRSSPERIRSEPGTMRA